ncbi:MAG: hypothetical protein K2M48_06755, partial [Clostridiales bacterium]|nr:hypothetical protein [Clostridiales bacterium]
LINAENAAADVKKAWDLLLAPDGMENATREDEINALLGSMDDIQAHLASAIGRFASDEPTAPSEKPTEITEITVPEFSDIVNGIRLTSVDGDLGADVSNKLTTGGVGMAKILASQGVNAFGKGILNGVSIENLDVNTALINADINFTAGCDVTIAPDMSALINVTDGENNTTYSNFSNIKHLLFDVLNTANMMEFGIGGVNTNDVINLKLSLGSLDLINFDIHYDIKVKIFTKAELAAMGIPVKNDDPELKTAAYVEFLYKDCKYLTQNVIPNCTTRLYFFDNMLYVDGLKITRKTFGINQTQVKCMYTLDQFTSVISQDIGKFLEEFVFYLVPFTRNLTNGFFLDIQGIIINNVADSTANDAENTDGTIAKVFKGYGYDTETGKHDVKIGLKELAGSSALGDLGISFTGANNNNDNFLDNYVQSLYIETNIVGSLVEVKLNANINNAQVYTDADGVDKIRSSWTDNGERADFRTYITDTIPHTAWQEIWA